MVHPYVNGYTKTLNHPKILWKTKKIKIPLETKRILKKKYKLSGCPAFTVSLPELAIRASDSGQLLYATGEEC